MKYENINLELFKKNLENKKNTIKEIYNTGSNVDIKEGYIDLLLNIDFCLKEINEFQEGLADDELEKNLKTNNK